MSENKKSPVNEMSVGGMGAGGFQLPLGAQTRKNKIDRAVKESGDLKEAHAAAFLGGKTDEQLMEFYDALDLDQHEVAAAMIREDVVRQAVRMKIREVVRKKAGGGGYVLYAPNKGKKHPSKPVGTFPTKLAAKRAELARFPPKDPKKLMRLRKEIERLMKDPKKRAEAELRAMKQKGTDVVFRPKKKVPKKHEAFDPRLAEHAILSEIVIRDVRRMAEGLFREERPGSKWDEVISKFSERVLKSDRGFQRIQKRLEAATGAALGQAVKSVQKALGGEAKVKAAQKPGSTDGGETYVPFHIQIEAASVGPIFVYVERGIPSIEMSDEAKTGLTKVTPGAAKAIRAALAVAQDNLEKVDTVQSVVAERDAYLDKLEANVDKQIASLSPLQVSMMKQLLVKKYRGSK